MSDLDLEYTIQPERLHKASEVEELTEAIKQRDAVTQMLWDELRANLVVMTPGEFAELIQSACGFIPHGFNEVLHD